MYYSDEPHWRRHSYISRFIWDKAANRLIKTNNYSLSERECIKYYQVSTSRSWSHLTSLTLNFKIFDLSDTHPASPVPVIIKLPVVILWLLVRTSQRREMNIDKFLIRRVIWVFIFSPAEWMMVAWRGICRLIDFKGVVRARVKLVGFWHAVCEQDGFPSPSF